MPSLPTASSRYRCLKVVVVEMVRGVWGCESLLLALSDRLLLGGGVHGMVWHGKAEQGRLVGCML